jgi:SAM-dependent methyltransferase
MSAACHRRAACRLCGSRDLQMVFALKPTPPANAFVPAPVPQDAFPLDVFFCHDCTHLQLLDVVDPSILFAHYVYVSGTSPVFVNHFKRYADEMVRRFQLSEDSLVVDIGSNDGTLLRQFKELGCRVLGIDPAQEISRQATASGIETINAFFTNKLAATLPKADLIVANNVFAHIDNLRDVVAGIRTMLQSTGAFVFEVSYLKDVYEKTLFDTIYHEHLDYHTVKPLVKFFRENGMQLIAAESVDAHGGSLRGTAAITRPVEPSVAEFVRTEERLGLDKAETYREFARKIDRLRDDLVTLLRRLKSEGKRIAAFGAPAKATTLMYHFGIGPDVVDFIVDDSPLKQGLYSPGHHIPVVPSTAIAEKKPDYLVILAWNFADSIIAKNKMFTGRWIVPVPTVKII